MLLGLLFLFHFLNLWICRKQFCITHFICINGYISNRTKTNLTVLPFLFSVKSGICSKLTGNVFGFFLTSAVGCKQRAICDVFFGGRVGEFAHFVLRNDVAWNIMDEWKKSGQNRTLRNLFLKYIKKRIESSRWKYGCAGGHSLCTHK